MPLQDYDCTNYANNEGSLIENYFKIIDEEKDDSIKNIEFEKIMGYTNEILNRYSSELKYYSSFSKNISHKWIYNHYYIQVLIQLMKFIN